MLKNVTAEDITRALRRDIDALPDRNTLIRHTEYHMAERFGRGAIKCLHPLLEPQIQAWIDGTEIPEFVCGCWSLRYIQDEWGCSFYSAVLAMTEYMKDPCDYGMILGGNILKSAKVPTKNQNK